MWRCETSLYVSQKCLSQQRSNNTQHLFSVNSLDRSVRCYCKQVLKLCKVLQRIFFHNTPSKHGLLSLCLKRRIYELNASNVCCKLAMYWFSRSWNCFSTKGFTSLFIIRGKGSSKCPVFSKWTWVLFPSWRSSQQPLKEPFPSLIGVQCTHFSDSLLVYRVTYRTWK